MNSSPIFCAELRNEEREIRQGKCELTANFIMTLVTALPSFSLESGRNGSNAAHT